MLNKPVAAAVAAVALLSAAVAPARAESVKNVVLVHGAFADGSGWQRVADILGKDGHTISVVQEPLTSLADDVAATKRVLDLQQGPTLLVGDEGGDVDEADDIRRIARFGDDHPAVAVADQKGGALLQIEHPFGRRDVVGK